MLPYSGQNVLNQMTLEGKTKGLVKVYTSSTNLLL